ncbi:hypothetical protein M3194_17140 [Paenibacillus glycanilyticus]|uniref:hypothetical protein n=1 Tax=Paenibacillus glycanilyticus TaxID=126569 RepID=UPI00203E5951|nr:hypothetical protein [Paenibacillus glycanilyticus]MCM3629074.1 hypothetical protein [Paenibacillus glycanilyticus]
MKRNWKLAGAALLVAIAVPVSAYAADNSQNSKSQEKVSYADAQTKQTGKQEDTVKGNKLNLDVLEIAKSKLGLDQAAFEQAQKAGKSLADIAKEKGKELQLLIDDLTKEISAAILVNLDTEKLTDQEKENVQKKASMEAGRILNEPLNKENVKQEGKDWNLAAALELIGIDKAAFAEQVHSGQSFVDIAKAHNISRQQLIDALVSDVISKMDDLKANGDLTQEQADKKRQAILKEVEDFVDHTQVLFAKKESSAAVQGKQDKQIRAEGIRIDFQQIAATKLGLDKEAFQKALEADKSLADIAQEQGKEVQPLIDELTGEISEEIQVKSTKSLTDEEKENVHKKAAIEAERVFKTPLNKEQEVREQGFGQYNMQAAFELLGIEKTTFAEQVQAGKSFVDIAKDHGVSRQKLIDTLMSDFTAKIAALQAKGDITQDQANQKKQAVLKEVEDFVDHTQTKFELEEKK